MTSERIDIDVRAADIWRTAQRRRAAYLAAMTEKPVDDADHGMARRLAIPTVLASGMVAVAVWALA